MMTFAGSSERAKIQPRIITVVPTVCQPPAGGDIETGDSRVPVANAVVVPTAWAALNPTVMPEPVPRDQSSDAFERERILISLYQRSRFIRIVTIIDLGFIIVFGLFQPLFFILIPFPICGYFGAKKWIYWLLFIYTVYLVIEIIGGIISLIYINTVVYIVVRVVYVLINIVIARYTTNLAGYILVLGPEDFEFLKNSPVVVNYEKSWCC